jgi:epoxyqueuosine reductase QueG
VIIALNTAIALNAQCDQYDHYDHCEHCEHCIAIIPQLTINAINTFITRELLRATRYLNGVSCRKEEKGNVFACLTASTMPTRSFSALHPRQTSCAQPEHAKAEC